MKKEKHKTPSRKRYEKNNPVWSVRMPKDWINNLEALLEATGQSRRYFLGAALDKLTFNYEEARVTSHEEGHSQGHDEGYQKGYNVGYNKGMNDWAIWVECYRCWQPVFIKPKSKAHDEIIDRMKGYLKHSQCPTG